MAEVKYLDLTGLQRYDQKIKEVINTGLDSKIGKDDVMLIISGGGSKTETVSFEQYGRYEIQDLHGNWTILVNGDGGYGPGSITLSDPNRDGAQISARSNYDTNVKFVCENGTIIAYGYDDNAGDYAEQGSLVEGNGLYYIEFNDKAFNGTIEIQSASTETTLNTNESLQYINDSLTLKADKSEVESSLALKADKAEVDTKIGVDDEMLNITCEVEVLSGDSARSNDLVGDEWCVLLNKSNSRIEYEVIPDIYLKNSAGKTIHHIDMATSYSYLPYKFEAKNGIIIVSNSSEKYEYTKTDNRYYIEIIENDDEQFIFTIEHINALNTKDSLEHLNSTLSTKITAEDLPTAVSQLTNDAGYAVAGDLKITEVTEELGENVAKAYKFEGGAESAVIEIPKDQTLKSVELGKYATEGDATSFVVDPTGEILRFTYIIADGSESVVDVNISNLITEAELDPVYAAIDEKVAAADIVKVTNEEIDAMFA